MKAVTSVFVMLRPFTPAGAAPAGPEDFAGLIILGAGPLGIVSGNLVPSLGLELRLASEFLGRRLPIVGIGFGACLLAVASGGGAEEAPKLRFTPTRTHSAATSRIATRLPSICGIGPCCRIMPWCWRRR